MSDMNWTKVAEALDESADKMDSKLVEMVKDKNPVGATAISTSMIVLSRLSLAIRAGLQPPAEEG